MLTTLATTLAYIDPDSDAIKMIIIFGTGGVIAVTAITFGIVRSAMVERQRQQTKRELAAYVAEGSMTPEDAERIIKAEPADKKG